MSGIKAREIVEILFRLVGGGVMEVLIALFAFGRASLSRGVPGGRTLAMVIFLTELPSIGFLVWRLGTMTKTGLTVRACTLQDKLRMRIASYLERGEHIQHVFPARVMRNPNYSTAWTYSVFRNTSRIVAVTENAILVFSAGFLNPMFPKWMVAVMDRLIASSPSGMFDPAFPRVLLKRISRDTKIGPLSHARWSRINIPGQSGIWVHWRFYQDVLAADYACRADGLVSQ